MCALVLGLRKVPIFGPGGGGAPLGDPANPTYNVAVSDDVAAAARAKAARDADAARLRPANANVPEDKEETLVKPTTGNGGLNPIPEGLTGDPLRDQETENDAFSIVGDQTLQSRAMESQLSSGSSTNIGKSKSVQGRRKPGLTAPTRASEISREVSNLENVASQANSRSFDPEAQTSR